MFLKGGATSLCQFKLSLVPTPNFHPLPSSEQSIFSPLLSFFFCLLSSLLGKTSSICPTVRRLEQLAQWETPPVALKAPANSRPLEPGAIKGVCSSGVNVLVKAQVEFISKSSPEKVSVRHGVLPKIIHGSGRSCLSLHRWGLHNSTEWVWLFAVPHSLCKVDVIRGEWG